MVRKGEDWVSVLGGEDMVASEGSESRLGTSEILTHECQKREGEREDEFIDVRKSWWSLAYDCLRMDQCRGM